jgi:hypothetical protein
VRINSNGKTTSKKRSRQREIDHTKHHFSFWNSRLAGAVFCDKILTKSQNKTAPESTSLSLGRLQVFEKEKHGVAKKHTNSTTNHTHGLHRKQDERQQDFTHIKHIKTYGGNI